MGKTFGMAMVPSAKKKVALGEFDTTTQHGGDHQHGECSSTTSVHHSYADTSPAIADSKFGKESDQDTGEIKAEMANGQRLSGAEEESNATAEATARQFLLKYLSDRYILLV